MSLNQHDSNFVSAVRPHSNPARNRVRPAIRVDYPIEAYILRNSLPAGHLD